MPEDLKKLFQITEAARACSLSRSCLLYTSDAADE